MSFAGLVVNIALNLALDGRFGAVGAAVALGAHRGLADDRWLVFAPAVRRSHAGDVLLRVVVPTAPVVAVAVLLSRGRTWSWSTPGRPTWRPAW